MEAEFRQDLCKRTMVVKRNADRRSDFREKMVMRNSIRGFARVSVKYLNGDSCYSYDMGSCQTFKDCFGDGILGIKELKALFSGIMAAAREAEKYLLDLKDFLMEPDRLLWDDEKCEPVFCYYPGNPEGEAGYETLGRFIIDRVDKEDEAATKAAYDYFERLLDGILLPEGIFRIAEEKVVIEEPPVEYRPPERTDPDENFYLDGEIKEEVEEEEGGTGPLLLILAVLPSLFSSAFYGFFFLDPVRLSALGLSDRDYIRAGIGVTVVSGLIITLGVYLWNRRSPAVLHKGDADSRMGR